MNTNAVMTPLRCESCTDTFTSHVDLALHSITHNESDSYTCHICDESESTSEKIITHIRRHDTYCCLKCKKIFKSKLSAYKHSKSHPVEQVACDICGLIVKAKCLNNHVRNKHTEDAPKKMYGCSVCPKVYLNIANLRSHYSQKHREVGIDVSVVCDVCGKKLSCKTKLVQHMRIHTGQKPYVCSYCLRGFVQKTLLDAHLRTHTGEKPFVCSYCGKRFAQGAPYRYHIKTHTGEKKFSCDLCGKRFIAKRVIKLVCTERNATQKVKTIEKKITANTKHHVKT
ncbi:unnamed protein product [Callosobruchus maculatus]|nr:unnamed protein product [Callosobruchus maculatus]